MRRLAWLGALVASIMGIAVPPAGAATPPAGENLGGIGIRLLPPRGAAIGSPLASTYIVGVVAPGTILRRRLEIGNSTHHAAWVTVYPAAASIRRGRFSFAAGRSRNELARWTVISGQRPHLSPGGQASVTLTVKVPRDASAGEHYAVVWAEVAATVRSGLRLVNRVGVRLYLTVGPGGKAPAAFTVGPLGGGRSTAGDLLVHTTVRNSGSRTLLIGGALDLSNGPGGSSAGPFAATLDLALVPGGSAELRVLVPRGLPSGPWLARLRLHSGQIRRVTSATVRFPRGTPVTRTVTRGGWGGRLLVVILLGAIGVAAVRARTVRGRGGFHGGRSVAP